MVHYQGNFNTPLSLKRYPFDRQTLRIVIEDEVRSTKKIVFAPDDNPVRISPDITLPGYEVGQPRISFGDFTYDVGPADQMRAAWTFPRIVVEIPLNAPTAAGVVKIMVPMVIVLAAAAIALVIPPAHIDSRIALPITSLLAPVAMHWGISSSLQDVNYLLMVDVLYIVGYATAIACLAVAIASAWVVRSRGDAAALGMQRRMLAAICLAYLVAVTMVLLGYLVWSV